MLWFALIVIFPIGLYYFSPGNWVALQIAWIFCVVISVLVSLAIILATQFTKQHVLLDLLTAIPVAVVSLSIGFPLAFSGAGASILGWLGLAF